MTIENLSSQFDSLRAMAHRASLTSEQTSTFQAALSAATAETVKSLGFGRPETKGKGIARLIKILEKSQESAWRR